MNRIVQISRSFMQSLETIPKLAYMHLSIIKREYYHSVLLAYFSNFIKSLNTLPLLFTLSKKCTPSYVFSHHNLWQCPTQCYCPTIDCLYNITKYNTDKSFIILRTILLRSWWRKNLNFKGSRKRSLENTFMIKLILIATSEICN